MQLTDPESIRIQDGAGEATGISLATLVLGALAIAAQNKDANSNVRWIALYTIDRSTLTQRQAFLQRVTRLLRR